MPGPLLGVRVVDFSNHAVGPWAASLLGWLGADVIKVEPPKGDPIREILPTSSGHPTSYTAVNQNKRSIVLDLKNPEQHAIALDLVHQADILVENFRSGVMDRLGLGYELVSRDNPRLIYCSSGSFGPKGPLARVGSTDSQGQAFGGYASLNGRPGSFAEISRNMAVIDSVGSLYLVQGALTALYARERTGLGQHVVTSQFSSVLSVQTSRLGHVFATGDSPRPMGSAVPHIVPSQAFRARDGRWIYLSAVTPAHWESLCAALGHPEWSTDPRFAGNAERVENRDTVVAAIGEAIATHEGTWWLRHLAAAGVPVSESLEYEDLRGHRHFAETESFTTTDLAGGGALTIPNAPWRFERSAVAGLRRAAVPNEHADEITAGLAAGRWPTKEDDR